MKRFTFIFTAFFSISTFDRAFADTPVSSIDNELDWAASPAPNNSYAYECEGAYIEPERENIDSTPKKDTYIYGSANTYNYSPKGFSELQGNVIFQQDDGQFQSDNALFDEDKSQIKLDGNIILREKGLLLKAQSGELNLQKKEYRLKNAKYVLHGPGLRGEAKEISMVANHQIYLRQATFTTCPPRSNDWSFTGTKIIINREEGWGTINNSVFRIKEVPVGYLPYFNFPIDSRRKTGILYPTITDLGQPDISIPFYWNIAPQYDATFTPRFIDQRGVLATSRFRYLSKNKGEGDFIFEEINKDKLFNSKSRSHGIWHHKIDEGKFSANADLNYLSDNNFFIDFEDDLQLNSQTYVDRAASFNWNDDRVQAGMIFQSYQIIDSTVTPENHSYRRMPESFLQLQKEVFHRFTWENLWQHVYFAQPDALSVPYANRLHWQSSLSYPWYQIWGFIEPKITAHISEYYFLGNHEGLSDTEKRVLPSFSLNSGLFFDKHYEEKKLTQTLEPRIFFSYVPFRDQSTLPNFESSEFTLSMEQLIRENRFSGFDRIGDAKQVSLMLWSRFISDQTGEEKALIRAGEAFYLEDPQVQINPGNTRHYSTSPFLLDGQFAWPQHTTTKMAVEYNHREELIQSGATEIQFHKNLNRILNLGYRYRRETIETDKIDQIQFSFSQSIHPKWRVLSAIQYDREGESSLGNILGLNYESCCWLLQMLYTQNIRPKTEVFSEDFSYKYSFIIEFVFKGLGNLGNKSERIFGNSIPGYNKFHYFEN